MRLEQLTSSMIDIYYPSQFKEMSNFIDEEWITSGETPYTDYPHPFITTPATTFPGRSPQTPQDPIFLKPSNSPRAPYGHNGSEILFPSFTTPTSTQGLCIETHGALSLLPSNVSSPTSESIPVSDFDFTGRRSTPVPIAPNPRGLHQMSELKRIRDEGDTGDYPLKKRNRSTSYHRTADLNEEEKLLLELKEDQGLPWKEIAQKFESTLGRTFQVPALQMRFKRLRERMRTWTENDVQALEKAHEWWERSQYEIISSKMVEFGAGEKWPAKYCEKKWQELHPETSAPSGLSLPPTTHWMQDTPVSIPASMPASVYGTPLTEHQQTPRLRTP